MGKTAAGNNHDNLEVVRIIGGVIEEDSLMSMHKPWGIYGLSVDNPWIIRKLSVNPWIIHGKSMDNPWIILRIIHGLCMDYPWIIIDYLWIIHGLSKDYPWMTHR